ncbi:MAG: VCBS repeat-containing protein [Deltaproteobacteria bacterium]|nr:VCBS repeat-containing protein [Deltaproteobacteria bacterium]
MTTSTLQRTGLLFLLLAAACSSSATVGMNGSGGTSGGDAATDSAGHAGDSGLPKNDSASGDGPSCKNGSCSAGLVCRFEQCVPTPKSCKTSGDCLDDTYCIDNECIPWGVGPGGEFSQQCTGATGPVGMFSPVQQCTWTAPPAGDAFPGHVHVLNTPMVVDFNFDEDPSVHKPSIVFVSSPDAVCGVVRVVDGTTCGQQFTMGDVQLLATSPVAVADIDLDGRPDIVGLGCGSDVVAYGYDAKTKAFKLLWTSNPASIGILAAGTWTGPSIHDLDDDGKPEILAKGTVWSNAGQLLDGSLVGSLNEGSISQGVFPAPSDFDGDGVVDMTDGATVWSWKGGKWTAGLQTGQAAGQVAFADFGTYGADPTKDDRSKLDGIPEIAVVSVNGARVQTLAGRIILGPIALANSGAALHPPAIADFDGDGRVEVSAADSATFKVLDPDCAASPQAATCPTLSTNGILWSAVRVGPDAGESGSCVFDFEGDGAAEAVYADVCFIRVHDGKTGDVIFSQPQSSWTYFENPVIADVDGDLHSEVVLASNSVGDPLGLCGGLGVMDPIFKGLRCQKDAHCASGKCDNGFCRCTENADCGGEGYVCTAPLAGTPGTGNVCRSAIKELRHGISVYRDAHDRWANSRMTWNQHAYSITNIDDDGRVPQTTKWLPNWKQAGLNNFRQNKPIATPVPLLPDLTGRILPQADPASDCSNSWVLSAEICNRGAAPVGAGLDGTFYEGDPRKGGKAVCTTETKQALEPGECEQVKCTWTDPPSGAVDLWFASDDDGTGIGDTSECDETNNYAHFPGMTCPGIKVQ